VNLTPTQRKILQFIADGGERGRMLPQVVSVGGSWPRQYQALAQRRVYLSAPRWK
jgi:hypothetical protein